MKTHKSEKRLGGIFPTYKSQMKCPALCSEHDLLLWEGYKELEGMRKYKTALTDLSLNV